MVSIVCSNVWNRSVKEFNFVLDKIRVLIIEIFEKSSNMVKDAVIFLYCVLIAEVLIIVFVGIMADEKNEKDSSKYPIQKENK